MNSDERVPIEVHICGLKSRDPKFLAALAKLFKAAYRQYAKAVRPAEKGKAE